MKLSTYVAPLMVTTVHYQQTMAASDTPPTFQLGTDSEFDFEYLAALGLARSGGSDIGPMLGAIQAVKPGDFSSYSDTFHKLALKTKAEAENPENAYDPINVQDTRFSAATYFRRADFFLHENWTNPLINSLWVEQTAQFDKAIASLPIPGERIQLPSKEGNFTVEAIWYAASQRKNQPTLIVGNGYDAAQEDSYHDYVVPALARGWNCITYEGPGQPTVRRNQNLGFVPQWEHAVTPVVDYLLTKKKSYVDTKRLVLLGNSFGGYLAARAAAFEPRLSALILIDGVWDTYEAFSSQLPSDILGIYEAGNYTQFDQIVTSVRESGKLPTAAAWGLDQGLWAFHTHSPSNFFNQIKKFNLKDIYKQIKMPVFIGEATLDTVFLGQPQKVKKALGSQAVLHPFTGVAGYHCAVGAGQELTRTIHAWLHKTLGKCD